MTVATSSRPLLLPKHIPVQHYLAKDLNSKFGAFLLEGSTVDLRPDMSSILATAQTVTLTDRAARKLGRRENSIEVAVAPLPDARALRPVDKFLSKLGVPKGEVSSFYALDGRRRTPGRLVDRDVARLPANIRRQLGQLLTVEHEIASQDVSILRVSKRDSKVWFDLIKPQGVLSLHLSKLGSGQVADENDDEDVRESETYATDSNQDFAACYSECFSAVPDWLIAVVAGICGTCTAALAVAPEPTVLMITCGACVAAVGFVLVNCVLTCHEMI